MVKFSENTVNKSIECSLESTPNYFLDMLVPSSMVASNTPDIL